jgi:hypothetical protein
MNQDKANCEYMAEKINENLIGGRITGAMITEDGESFGLKVSSPIGRFQVWVDRDPEGNGPGWLSIESV